MLTYPKKYHMLSLINVLTSSIPTTFFEDLSTAYLNTAKQNRIASYIVAVIL